MTTATRSSPGTDAPAGSERTLYAAMLRMRRFEEKAGMLYALGTLGTPCSLGIGQEGAIAAVVAALRHGDAMVVLSGSPVWDLAIGAPASQVFKRLLTAHEASADTAIVRVPGEPLHHVGAAAALDLAAARHEAVILVAYDPGALASALRQLPKGTLPIIILPSDRRPDSWSQFTPSPVRELDGSDAQSLLETLQALRLDLDAGHPPAILAILTPPYAGHARDAGRRAPQRRTDTDPIARSRQQLLAAGRCDEAAVAALEASIRDEIAAAGRAIAMACT